MKQWGPTIALKFRILFSSTKQRCCLLAYSICGWSHLTLASAIWTKVWFIINFSSLSGRPFTHCSVHNSIRRRMEIFDLICSILIYPKIWSIMANWRTKCWIILTLKVEFTFCFDLLVLEITSNTKFFGDLGERSFAFLTFFSYSNLIFLRTSSLGNFIYSKALLDWSLIG